MKKLFQTLGRAVTQSLKVLGLGTPIQRSAWKPPACDLTDVHSLIIMRSVLLSLRDDGLSALQKECMTRPLSKHARKTNRLQHEAVQQTFLACATSLDTLQLSQDKMIENVTSDRRATKRTPSERGSDQRDVEDSLKTARMKIEDFAHAVLYALPSDQTLTTRCQEILSEIDAQWHKERLGLPQMEYKQIIARPFDI
jgi:hypothetical protein